MDLCQWARAKSSRDFSGGRITTQQTALQGVFVRPEWSALAETLEEYRINQDLLRKFTWSEQSIRKGYALVACGSLYQLEHKLAGPEITLSGYVHSEMKASEVYTSSIVLEKDSMNYLSHRCSCKGMCFSVPFS
jgi:hypothetical protein